MSNSTQGCLYGYVNVAEPFRMFLVWVEISEEAIIFGVLEKNVVYTLTAFYTHELISEGNLYL